MEVLLDFINTELQFRQHSDDGFEGKHEGTISMDFSSFGIKKEDLLELEKTNIINILTHLRNHVYSVKKIESLRSSLINTNTPKAPDARSFAGLKNAAHLMREKNLQLQKKIDKTNQKNKLKEEKITEIKKQTKNYQIVSLKNKIFKLTSLKPLIENEICKILALKETIDTLMGYSNIDNNRYTEIIYDSINYVIESLKINQPFSKGLEKNDQKWIGVDLASDLIENIVIRNTHRIKHLETYEKDFSQFIEKDLLGLKHIISMIYDLVSQNHKIQEMQKTIEYINPHDISINNMVQDYTKTKEIKSKIINIIKDTNNSLINVPSYVKKSFESSIGFEKIEELTRNDALVNMIKTNLSRFTKEFEIINSHKNTSQSEQNTYSFVFSGIENIFKQTHESEHLIAFKNIAIHKKTKKEHEKATLVTQNKKDLLIKKLENITIKNEYVDKGLDIDHRNMCTYISELEIMDDLIKNNEKHIKNLKELKNIIQTNFDQKTNK